MSTLDQIKPPLKRSNLFVTQHEQDLIFENIFLSNRIFMWWKYLEHVEIRSELKNSECCDRKVIINQNFQRSHAHKPQSCRLLFGGCFNVMRRENYSTTIKKKCAPKIPRDETFNAS